MEKKKAPFEIILTQHTISGALDDVTRIATGGMAEIYRARQQSLDRYVVVKKLREELLKSAEVHERFRREAKALASVLHQNIAHVYDYVETDHEAFIVMEYIDGVDLSTIIEKVGNLPPKIAALIILGVAKGVDFIHAHHLIHRDIKPSNIRLTTRGGVKLMDFGIVMDTEQESLTRPGLMVGSPHYLSPEQVLGDPLTARADIFLLGICFYEMLTGTRPFREEDGETVFQRIREAKYTDIRSMQKNVPSGLAKIVRKCLQKSPDNRYGSVKELVTELESFLGAHWVGLNRNYLLRFLDAEALLSPIVTYETEESKVGWKEQIPKWRWVIALALSALLFMGGYWMGKSTTSSEPAVIYKSR